jgi:hypothetical protein
MLLNTISLHRKVLVPLLNQLPYILVMEKWLVTKKTVTSLLSFLYHFFNFLPWVYQTSRNTLLNLGSMVDTVSHPRSLWPNHARRHKEEGLLISSTFHWWGNPINNHYTIFSTLGA